LEDIEAARMIVGDAVAQMTRLNKARLDKPLRNNFNLAPGTKRPRNRRTAGPPPLLKVTDEVARAAALLAEIDVNITAKRTSYTGHYNMKRAGTFWMETIGKAHKGTVPWGGDSSYRVVPHHDYASKLQEATDIEVHRYFGT
jgi:hypothetical protein